MDNTKAPLIRLGSVILIIFLLLYLPTREFLKITFMLGIPFTLFLIIMKKNLRYSPLWIISVIALVFVTGFYIYTLTDLPERIETRRIIMEGESLVAEGKFDEAVANYRKLEAIGRSEKMKDRIARVEEERTGDILIKEAGNLIAEGQNEEARELLMQVPVNTRAEQEAVRMLRILSK